MLSCSSHNPVFAFFLPPRLPSDLSQKLQGSEPQLLRDPWVHCQECVSFLTLQHSLSTNKKSRRRVGRKREGCQDVGSSLEVRKKKKGALCGRLSDRIWSNPMALAFDKIASFNGHSLEDASPDTRPHMSEQLTAGQRKNEGISGREKTARGCFRSSVFC